MIAALGCGLLLAGCSNEDRARRKLNDTGHTEVRILGMAWFRCGLGKDATRFEARDGGGRPVAGVVCSGWLKGDVIETDR
jgi:hypothetical protein